MPPAILFWWVVAGVWGILYAWLYRDYMNPDGISYLDMASDALAYGPRGLVNAYWSPLYPALIAVWELIIRPSAIQEFAAVHALNAVIYFVAAISFGFFLRELILFRASDRGSLWNQGAFIAFGFAIFFHYLNATLWAITPDILVAVIAFAAAGLFFRILRTPEKSRAYVALGCVLGVGYYAKSILLPAAAVLLGVLFICRYRSGRHRKNVAIAAFVMLVTCVPQIAMVSQRVGRLSLAETGRLNYLWWVQGVRQFQGWTGTPGSDVPVHGPRVVMRDPEVLEFGKPIGGTYPLWFDPGYWYAGARIRFNLQQQLATVRTNLLFYKSHFPYLLYPLAGLVVLIGLSVARARPSVAESWFLLWPLALLLMYALLLMELRYAAPWLVLFWTGAYSALLKRNGITERLLLVLLASLILVSSFRDFQGTYRNFSRPAGETANVVMARDLDQIGIKAGDPIATVGLPFGHDYARVARLHIVAQVTDGGGFWSLSPETITAVEQSLADSGAKILVGSGRPSGFQPENWRDMPGTVYSVRLLGKAAD